MLRSGFRAIIAVALIALTIGATRSAVAETLPFQPRRTRACSCTSATSI